MQARYYDPVIGRFYSNDPMSSTSHLAKGNAHGFGRYTYANNNPYKYVEPDGKEGVGVRLDIRTKALTSGNITADNFRAQNQAEAVGGAIGTAMVAAGACAASAVCATAFVVAEFANDPAPGFSGANSATSGLNLEKQLVSQSQLTELAEGAGTVISQPAKQANRIASQTGVDAANVQKVSSSAHVAKDGQTIQTHAFRDASTNNVIEPKTIINEDP